MTAAELRAQPFCLDEGQIAWIEHTLGAMSYERKAGQLFCVMGGDYSEEELLSMAAAGKMGGVLFRPVMAREQLRARLDALDAAAEIPLLKAANLEEGGSGGMSDGTLFGWPMLAAATDDVETARRFGAVCGAEGAAAGINWSFSPVCDLDLNYLNPITNVRTFGSDLERVMAFTAAYAGALRENGVAACAKHFPGDGVDYRDQHLHPTCNSLPAGEWYRSYGAVYENLIRGGMLSIMAGHIAQPNVALDADHALTERERYLPASLSRTLLTGVLRGRLGFNGLITTDATIMGGYTMAMERRRAIPASIMAGCDMLVFTTDLNEDLGYVLQGLKSGLLTQERLDEAVTRVLALKARVCAPCEMPPAVPGRKWHRQCADRAITLVKNVSADALPMTPARYPSVRLVTLGKDETADGAVRALARACLESRGFAVEEYDPFADELHGTSDLPSGRLTLYFANFEQASNQTVVRIGWCPKHALDIPRFVEEEPSVFVCLANPYHLQDVPRIKTYINAYTATRDTIELTIDKLMGRSPFLGTSPVDAFCGLPDARL